MYTTAYTTQRRTNRTESISSSLNAKFKPKMSLTFCRDPDVTTGRIFRAAAAAAAAAARHPAFLLICVAD